MSTRSTVALAIKVVKVVLAQKRRVGRYITVKGNHLTVSFLLDCFLPAMRYAIRLIFTDSAGEMTFLSSLTSL